MSIARIARVQVVRGAVGDVVREAERSLYPEWRRSRGFIAYEIVKTGDDSFVSVSTWTSRHDADEAAEIARDWVRDHVADRIVSSEVWSGEILSASRGPLEPV